MDFSTESKFVPESKILKLLYFAFSIKPLSFIGITEKFLVLSPGIKAKTGLTKFSILERTSKPKVLKFTEPAS